MSTNILYFNFLSYVRPGSKAVISPCIPTLSPCVNRPDIALFERPRSVQRFRRESGFHIAVPALSQNQVIHSVFIYKAVYLINKGHVASDGIPRKFNLREVLTAVCRDIDMGPRVAAKSG